jgi:hypothetical protein
MMKYKRNDEIRLKCSSFLLKGPAGLLKFVCASWRLLFYRRRPNYLFLAAFLPPFLAAFFPPFFADFFPPFLVAILFAPSFQKFFRV